MNSADEFKAVFLYHAYYSIVAKKWKQNNELDKSNI